MKNIIQDIFTTVADYQKALEKIQSQSTFTKKEIDRKFKELPDVISFNDCFTNERKQYKNKIEEMWKWVILKQVLRIVSH